MTSLDIRGALLLDVGTVLVCGLVALRCASSLLHPAAVMLAAHGYIVTLRLAQLARGFKPMAYSFAWPIGEGEIVRAAVCSDLALVAMAMGWIVVKFWGRRDGLGTARPRIVLSDHRLLAFAAASFCMAVGATAILGPHALREVAGDHSASTSGYLLAAAGWAGWSFCLLHFRYGFGWQLLLATAAVLGSVMLLSTFRGAVVIPIVFLLCTWLARRRERGFPWALLPATVCLWLIWLPMKPVVYAVQAGESFGDALATGVETAFTNFGEDQGSGIDFQFLDMIASTMTLVDVHGGLFFGRTFEPLFVSPIPRQLWPGKPELNQYQQELDIPPRAMAKLHMTAGLIGEAYANFGYLGVMVVPFAISVAFSAACRRLTGSHLLSPGCLLYLMYLSTYMQLYRDGLIAAVWFPFVHCAPVGWAAVSHWIWPPRQPLAAEPPSFLPTTAASRFPSLTTAVRG